MADNMIIDSLQNLTEYFFCSVFVKDRCELIHHKNIFFESGNKLFVCTRHQLHNKSSCSADGGIGVYKDTESTGRRNLFAFKKIRGNIFCYFAAYQLGRPDIGFFESDISADSERSVLSDGTSNIELSVTPQRKINGRIADITSDISEVIRDGNDPGKRTVTGPSDAPTTVPVTAPSPNRVALT